MAFAATTEWDVQTTGSDAAGGGFDTASSGTDRSQGAVFQAYTDIVIDATTNTKISSAAHPFDATSVGNIINITAGTGFTVQRVQIVSQVAGLATCDKAVGTTSSTGGTGNLGGSLLTVDFVTKNTALFVAGNTLHIKAGTYTRTTTWIIDTSNNSGNLSIIGYQTTHNDGGTKPLITTATNSIKLIQMGAALYTLINLSFSNTASVRADGIWFGGTSTGPTVINCIFDGFVVALNGDNGAGGAAGFVLDGVEVKNCTSDGCRFWFPTWAHGCYFHANTGDGIQSSTTNPLSATYSLFVNNTGRGYGATGANSTLFATNCDFSNNTSDGIGNGNAAMTLIVSNCIIYGNGGWGVNVANTGLSGNRFSLGRNNGYGGPNVSGNRRNNTFNQFGDITITSDPFTSSAGGDYSLNSTAGGGALCKVAGFPGVFPGGLSTGYVDIGAVDSGTGGPAPPSGSLLVNPGMTGGMRG